MSEKDPSSKKGLGAAAQGSAQKGLLCEDWEALLVDALDGKLAASDAAAFEAHRESCMACAQLLEEAKRGTEWLHFLETEPEVPVDLVGRILAQTSGATDVFQVPAPSYGTPVTPDGMLVAVPVGAGWVAGWLPRVERHAVQSRWMMTAAMAFFSIAFTLNLTGVKLNSFRLADLRPTTLASTLTRQFYAADKGVVRYYESLTFFYEVESRVREMKRIVEPVSSDTITPAPNGSQNGNKTTGDDKTASPAAKHTGGSAERQAPPAAAPVPGHEAKPMGEPVEARFTNNLDSHRLDSRRNSTESVCFRVLEKAKNQVEETTRKSVAKMRAERSLA